MLGQKVPVNFDLSKQSEVANEVVKQYMEDYAKAWDGLLQDIEIAPLRSLNQASQDLYILASKQSPLKELLVAIAPAAHACRSRRSLRLSRRQQHRNWKRLRRRRRRQ